MTTVTITSVKPSRVPAFSPFHVVVGPATGAADECSFRYLLEVYRSEDNYLGNPSPTWTKVATLRQAPGPENAAVFDVGPVVRSYLRNLCLVEAQQERGRSAAGGMYGWFRVDAGCEYDDSSVDCTAAPTQFLAQDQHEFIAWNAALPYEIPFTSYYPDYLFAMTTSDPRRFLLESPPPEGIPVRDGQGYNLFFHNYDSPTPDNLSVDTYAGGSFVATFSYDLSAVNAPAVGYDVLAVGAGPLQLNVESQAEVGYDIITPAVDRYVVYLRDGSGNRISEFAWFKVDRSCPVDGDGDEPYQLAWLNPWGGVDTLCFTGQAVRSVATRRNTYERVPESYFAGTYSHSVNSSFGGDRGRTVLSSQSRARYRLSTGFVGDGVARWLEHLFTSPAVWLVRRDLEGFSPVATTPVQVTSAAYEERSSSRTKRLVTYQIEVESDVEKPLARG